MTARIDPSVLISDAHRCWLILSVLYQKLTTKKTHSLSDTRPAHTAEECYDKALTECRGSDARMSKPGAH